MWIYAYIYLGAVLISPLFRTAGPEILPSQTYDYDALTSFALKSSQLTDWSTTVQAEPNKDETGDGEGELGNS